VSADYAKKTPELPIETDLFAASEVYPSRQRVLPQLLHSKQFILTQKSVKPSS
jgi:hypothetical protein